MHQAIVAHQGEHALFAIVADEVRAQVLADRGHSAQRLEEWDRRVLGQRLDNFRAHGVQAIGAASPLWHGLGEPRELPVVIDHAGLGLVVVIDLDLLGLVLASILACLVLHPVRQCGAAVAECVGQAILVLRDAHCGAISQDVVKLVLLRIDIEVRRRVDVATGRGERGRAILEVVLAALVLDLAAEDDRAQVVSVAPVELERKIDRQVRMQLGLGRSQLDTQFVRQLVAQRLVHVHPVAFHFDGRNEGTELQHKQAAHAFLLRTGKLLEEHVAGNANVTLAAVAVGQVLAQQVAGQQVRVNVRCVDACFPQLLHLVNLQVLAVAQGQLVH